jgi:hydroxyacylglutathione hydrolase
MKQLADGVWQLDGFPRNLINVYLVEDVLIDAGLVIDRRRVLKQLGGRTLTAHAITHAHLDHYGSSRAVCEKFGVPMWCGAADVEMVEAGKMLGPRHKVIPAAPKCKVARGLREGDEVAGFKVLDTPGHSPGHVSYWRESDRVLICGDVIWGCNPFLGFGPPQEPFPFVSPDAALNRESARRLAALEPALVCFGHGAPLRDTARFQEVVAKLAG